MIGLRILQFRKQNIYQSFFCWKITLMCIWFTKFWLFGWNKYSLVLPVIDVFFDRLPVMKFYHRMAFFLSQWMGLALDILRDHSCDWAGRYHVRHHTCDTLPDRINWSALDSQPVTEFAFLRRMIERISPRSINLYFHSSIWLSIWLFTVNILMSYWLATLLWFDAPAHTINPILEADTFTAAVKYVPSAAHCKIAPTFHHYKRNRAVWRLSCAILILPSNNGTRRSASLDRSHTQNTVLQRIYEYHQATCC